MQSNKSDSNYVAVTRHRRYHLNSSLSTSSVNPNYLSSCPPILRVLHNNSNQSKNYHHINTTGGTKKISPNTNMMMITRLDDDDIWFSSLSHGTSSNRGTHTLSNYRTGSSTTNQHDSDMNDHGNGTGTGDGTNMNHPTPTGTGTGNFDDPDDFSPDIVGATGIGSSSIQDDLTIVAPHSSITANVAYYERRRREDGWNDLGLDTIVSLRNNNNNNTTHHNHHHLSNVVPFDGSSSDDATTTTTQQQQQQQQNTNND